MTKPRSVIRIVDDDPTIRESQSFFLRLGGFEVKTYEDAQDFLTHDDLSLSGCVILDVRMPGMTGLELQALMNQKEVDLPIIFLSAHGDIEMALGCVRAGAFDFLVKPPVPEKLQELCHKAVLANIQHRRDKAYSEQLFKRWQTLTSAEKEVATLVSKGLSSAEIASIQGVSERTIQTHRSRVHEKLETANAVEVAEYLREMGAVR